MAKKRIKKKNIHAPGEENETLEGVKPRVKKAVTYTRALYICIYIQVDSWKFANRRPLVEKNKPRCYLKCIFCSIIVYRGVYIGMNLAKKSDLATAPLYCTQLYLMSIASSLRAYLIGFALLCARERAVRRVRKSTNT